LPQLPSQVPIATVRPSRYYHTYTLSVCGLHRRLEAIKDRDKARSLCRFPMATTPSQHLANAEWLDKHATRCRRDQSNLEANPGIPANAGLENMPYSKIQARKRRMAIASGQRGASHRRDGERNGPLAITAGASLPRTPWPGTGSSASDDNRGAIRDGETRLDSPALPGISRRAASRIYNEERSKALWTERSAGSCWWPTGCVCLATCIED
jgi:hypothetical protein